jgi:hypothetical protein
MAYLLTGLLVLPTMGIFIFLQANLLHHQWKQRFGHAQGEMKTIRLHQHHFDQQRRGEHELKWQGRLYDIKSLHIEGDSVRIIAFEDTYELQLLFQIGHVLGWDTTTPNNDTKTALNWLQRLIHIVYLPSDTIVYLIDYQQINTRSAIVCSVEMGWRSALQLVIVPPPEMVMLLF